MRAAFADLDREGRNPMHELLASAFPALRRVLGPSAPVLGNGGGTGGGGRGEEGRETSGQDPFDPTPPAELEPGLPPPVDAVVPLPATAWLMVVSLLALLRAGRRANR